MDATRGKLIVIDSEAIHAQDSTAKHSRTGRVFLVDRSRTGSLIVQDTIEFSARPLLFQQLHDAGEHRLGVAEEHQGVVGVE